jgi:hypothetical protein
MYLYTEKIMKLSNKEHLHLTSANTGSEEAAQSRRVGGGYLAKIERGFRASPMPDIREILPKPLLNDQTRQPRATGYHWVRIPGR